ncbi:hypothetical protein BGZ96_009542, partial [Linnemannia gamsii]
MTQLLLRYYLPIPNSTLYHKLPPWDNDKDSLSSIVSKLVKAAMRGKDTDDYGDDLDKYVANMLVRSATDKKQLQQQQQRQQEQEGLNNKAFLPSGTVVDRANSNGLKTNKRFLSSIIKSTDDHNQALIRAEEKRANEMTKELLAELDKKASKRERVQTKERRAQEIANEFLAELDRKAIARVKKTGSLNNKNNDKDKFQYGRMRMDEIEGTTRRKPHYNHHRQRSFSRSVSPHSLESRSPSPSRSRSRSHSPSGSYSRFKPTSRSTARSRSPTATTATTTSSKKNHTPATSATTRDHRRDLDSRDYGSSSRSILGSKMDKYFQEGYDPLLDTHSGDDTPVSVVKDKPKKKKSNKDKKKSSKKSSKHDKEKKDKKRHHHSDSDEYDNSEDDERSSSRKRKRKSTSSSSTHKHDKESRS